jgi:hypothetical protein
VGQLDLFRGIWCIIDGVEGAHRCGEVQGFEIMQVQLSRTLMVQ